ncbi:hypothetical protein QTO34_010587 [Cnephaeus nilssonii]|uniref:Uncharacterized protein n=1 Tax=Cnephaeus nilssonii TaxID=3371016 RepID=A0AA40HFW4_CNENI|nr:hypothetical protein QTO34_010587 [Eptesicus nilssonii]
MILRVTTAQKETKGSAGIRKNTSERNGVVLHFYNSVYELRGLDSHICFCIGSAAIPKPCSLWQSLLYTLLGYVCEHGRPVPAIMQLMSNRKFKQ